MKSAGDFVTETVKKSHETMKTSTPISESKSHNKQLKNLPNNATVSAPFTVKTSDEAKKKSAGRSESKSKSVMRLHKKLPNNATVSAPNTNAFNIPNFKKV